MIRVPRVRLIGPEDEQLGVVTSDEAKRMARDSGYDLVEISPTADPPVCRIMDYGKFKYEQKKKAQESKKKQHNFTVKEVRVRPKTGAHDIEVKIKRARTFLEAGDKVQLTVLFRGREVVHARIGMNILEDIAHELAEIAKVERAPRMEGKRMHMILTPIRRPAPPKKASAPPRKPMKKPAPQESAPQESAPQESASQEPTAETETPPPSE